MKLPESVAKSCARFDRLAMRERLLVTGASAIALVMLWTVVFFDPAAARERAAQTELSSLRASIDTSLQSIRALTAADPVTAALAQERQLKQELAAINAQLASKSAGLIPPERMVQVVHDVLSRQHGVTLVSLRNAPVTTLTETAQTETAEAPAATGPYLHPVELVIEGRYLDVLAYLRALENLEWRFYWRLLELKTTEYPINRVRIELSTLSLDKDWIGV